MATRIKLKEFLMLEGESKQKFARDIGIGHRTVYEWLNDKESEYLVHFDGRNNKVIKVVKCSEKALYVRGDK